MFAKYASKDTAYMTHITQGVQILNHSNFADLRICKGYKGVSKIQERLSVLAAPRMVRSTFHFARLRSAGGVYLSGGLKPATETSRILTYPPLIETGVFPTEINMQ